MSVIITKMTGKGWRLTVKVDFSLSESHLAPSLTAVVPLYREIAAGMGYTYILTVLPYS